MGIKKIGIYAIRCRVEKDKKAIYIGQSADIDRRWAEHKTKLRYNNHGNGYLQNSWNKYGESAFYFNVLEECEESMLSLREQYWLDEFKCRGYQTYNWGECTDSPTRGMRLSDKTRERMSKAQKGRSFTDETRKKMSDARKGKNNPMFGKLGGLNPLYGRTLSDEHREKISNARLGHPLSNNTKRKLRDARIGKPSPMLGKHLTDVTRLKMSNVRKGVPKSDETRRKMSEAKKAYWESRKNPGE